MYYVPIAPGAHTDATDDIVSIEAPAAGIIVLHELRIAQETEFGDAAAEMLHFRLRRASAAATVGSGGSAITVQAADPDGVAASFTARSHDTTPASGGGIATMIETFEHVASGWHFLPTPECRPSTVVNGMFVVDLGTAPDDSVSLGGYALVEEIGT